MTSGTFSASPSASVLPPAGGATARVLALECRTSAAPALIICGQAEAPRRPWPSATSTNSHFADAAGSSPKANTAKYWRSTRLLPVSCRPPLTVMRKLMTIRKPMRSASSSHVEPVRRVSGFPGDVVPPSCVSRGLSPPGKRRASLAGAVPREENRRTAVVPGRAGRRTGRGPVVPPHPPMDRCRRIPGRQRQRRAQQDQPAESALISLALKAITDRTAPPEQIAAGARANPAGSPLFSATASGAPDRARRAPTHAFR